MGGYNIYIYIHMYPHQNPWPTGLWTLNMNGLQGGFAALGVHSEVFPVVG